MSTQRIALAKLRRNAAVLAQQEALDTFKQAFPVGGPILWEDWHGNAQAGLVVSHGYSDRVEVKNTVTRAKYWVRHYRVLSAYRSNGEPV